MQDYRRIVGALVSFIRSLIDDRTFDFIVPIERKGTALVRSALGSADMNEWRRVVSSTALDTLFLGGERRLKILLFDDSVWKGRSLAAVKKKLLSTAAERGVECEVVTAAFMSHERAAADDLDIVYYRGLDERSYVDCRTAVVNYLQFEGSLLLDTEHVEGELTVEGNVADFYSAIAGWGDAVMFPSIAQRVNCTAYQSASRLERELLEVLPPFASISEAVCKVRIISRPDDHHRFVAIPICYAPIKLRPDTRYGHPRMTWTQRVSEERRLFHCVGLCLSIEVLRDFVSHISSVLKSRLKFNYEPGLGHLLPVFPEMVVAEMRSELDRISISSRRKNVKTGHIDDRGYEQVKALAKQILESCYSNDADNDDYLRRISITDVLDVAHTNGQPEARASAALDLLIDEAKILPDIMLEEFGAYRLATRVFGPDGESVRRRVVREALLAGRGLRAAAG